MEPSPRARLALIRSIVISTLFPPIPSLTSTDEKSVAYFRGRKLYGKTVPLPQQYQGVVIEELAADTPEQPLPTDLESEEDQHMAPEKRKELQVKAEFNEMTIWDHEAMVDAAEDPYLRSMEEWVQLAEQVGLQPCAQMRV